MRKWINALLGILIVISMAFSNGSVSAVSKADYVQHVETKADITSAYTIYMVCNPTGKDMVLNSDSDFSFAFQEVKNSLNSWDVKIEEVENYIEEVPIYDHVDVPIETTIHDNSTGQDTVLQTVKMEKVQIGVNQIPKTRKIWKTFQPKGKTFGVDKCYRIKVEGTYPARTGGTKIDNILSFAGYTYDEYAWWANGTNWSHKQQINITNNNATEVLEEGYSINISIDHFSLVDAGKSNSNGRDIRIVYTNTSGDFSLDWINTTAFDLWNQNATIFFKLQASISAGGYDDANYSIYYGNPSAGTPPTNGMNVFLLYDDFDDGTINTSIWSTTGSWTESGGIITANANNIHLVSLSGFGPGTRLLVNEWHNTDDSFHFGFFNVTSGSVVDGIFIYGDLNNDGRCYTITGGTGGYTQCNEYNEQTWEESTITWEMGNASFWLDGNYILSRTSNVPTDSFKVQLADFNPDSSPHQIKIDMVSVSKLLSPEPSAVLLVEENQLDVMLSNPTVTPSSGAEVSVFNFTVGVTSINGTSINVTLHVFDPSQNQIFKGTSTLQNSTALMDGYVVTDFSMKLNDTGTYSYFWQANLTTNLGIGTSTIIKRQPTVYTLVQTEDLTVPPTATKIMVGAYWIGFSNQSGIEISLNDLNTATNYSEHQVPTFAINFKTAVIDLPLVPYNIMVYSGYKEMVYNSTSVGADWQFTLTKTDVSRVETEIGWS